MKYLRYKSLTWWTGVVSTLLGMAQLLGIDNPNYGTIASFISALTGGVDTSPAGLIVIGLGLIGLRDKLEREVSNLIDSGDSDVGN